VAEYNPQQMEAKWQSAGLKRASFETDVDPAKPKYYAAGNAAVPSARSHGHMPTTPLATCGARKAHAWLQRPASHGLGRFRLARRKRRHQEQTRTRARDQQQHANFSASCAVSAQLTTGGANFHLRAGNTIAGTNGFSCACSSAASPPQEESCQLVPEVLHRAGQRAGRKRRLLRRHEDTLVESAKSSMVPEDHHYAEQLLDDLKQLEGGCPERSSPCSATRIGKSIGARVKFAVGRCCRRRTHRSLHHAHRYHLRRQRHHPRAHASTDATLIAGSPQEKDAQVKLAQMRQTSVKAEDSPRRKDRHFTGR